MVATRGGARTVVDAIGIHAAKTRERSAAWESSFADVGLVLEDREGERASATRRSWRAFTAAGS
jgi:hypothetical protein